MPPILAQAHLGLKMSKPLTNRIMVLLALAAAGTTYWSFANAQDMAPTPVAPSSSVVTSGPDANGLVTKQTTTPLSDGLSGVLVTTLITNPPIPDSVATRKAYGGPDSASGRATAPHPGPTMSGPQAPPASAPK